MRQTLNHYKTNRNSYSSTITDPYGFKQERDKNDKLHIVPTVYGYAVVRHFCMSYQHSRLTQEWVLCIEIIIDGKEWFYRRDELKKEYTKTGIIRITRRFAQAVATGGLDKWLF